MSEKGKIVIDTRPCPECGEEAEACIDFDTPLPVTCPKGHFHEITWNEWQDDKRCPKCKEIDK